MLKRLPSLMSFLTSGTLLIHFVNPEETPDEHPLHAAVIESEEEQASKTFLDISGEEDNDERSTMECIKG